MSLSITHSSGAYEDVLFGVLKFTENRFLATNDLHGTQFIHSGGDDGNPTIGYGYNLNAHTGAQNEAALKVALGYETDTPLANLPQDIQDGLEILRDWKANVFSNQDIIDIAQGNGGTAAQQQALRSLVMDDASATQLLSASINGLLDANEQVILADRELGLNAYLNGNNPNSIDISAGSASTIDDSNERATIMSLYYNNPALVGPHLLAALRDDQREEAWYEIRYQSNGDQENGIARRRYWESEIFGLHADPNAISKSDALRTFGMYTRHERDILEYENTYSNEIDDANDQYELVGDNTIGTRQEELDPARQYLAATFLSFNEGHIGEGESARDVGLEAWGSGENSLRADLEDLRDELVAMQAATTNVDSLLEMRANLQEVFVASETAVVGEVAAHTVDRPAIESLAGASHDLIFGTNGADTLLAGGEEDAIIGSAGSDSIHGGTGIDVVIYAESGAGVQIDLETGTAAGGYAAGDTLVGVENVIGSAYADELTGDDNDNILIGLNGADTLTGGNGDDVLHGGDGVDTILGELGTDYLFGGAGADTFIISHDGPGSSEVPDIIFDADTGDRAILDGLELTGGTRDLYYLEIDEFENESWVPNEDLYWVVGEDDGSIVYLIEGDDLTVDIYNEGGEYSERFVIKNWEQGDLGLQLVDVDNRYPLDELRAGGGDEPALAMADLLAVSEGELFGDKSHDPAGGYPQMEKSAPDYGAGKTAHAEHVPIYADG